jgi:hypothetical protein
LAAIISVSEYQDRPEANRPRALDLRIAATIACAIYEAWRTLNKKREIFDHGHRGAMKDAAAREAIEDYFSWRFTTELDLYKLEGNSESFIEAVRILMDKPRHRRDPGDNPTFPCPVLPTKDGEQKTPKAISLLALNRTP